MSPGQALVLFAAAFVAGLVNAIAGGGTLVSFPALVWVGLDPILANGTNTVTLWPGSLAATVALRREVAAQRRWIAALSAPSLAGGLAGAALLLVTPPSTFAVIVPYLMALATGLFALQGVLVRPAVATAAADASVPAGGLIAFQLAVAVYGGYFGAGIGLLTLAGLGLFGFTDIHEMVAIRNWCALLINGIAAAYFVARGNVSWPAAIVMLAGQIVGGYGGANLARRFAGPAVRRWIVLIGIAMTAWLFVRQA